jgi:CRISPR/Cas system-associated exonuclease Cas4 (RecB family)
VGKLKNELTWSKSRDGAFKECRRKYWNLYYGSWGGWERNAAKDVRRLYLLKQVDGRHAWVGKEVHERVRMCLKMLKAGQTPELATQMDSMVATMRNRFKESKKGDWVHNPKHILRLFEHEYEFNLKPEKWVELREHAKNSLRGFFESPYFELAKTLPLDRWRAVEDLDSFQLDGTKVWVALDFAFEREDGGCTIVDWKTGKNADPSEHVLQMHTYAMHANETWGYPLEKIRIVVYFLGRQHGDEFVPDPEGVKRSRAAIVESVAAMREALVDQDAGRNEARMDDFPMTENRQRCNWCEFRGVCWPDGVDAG